MVRTVTSGVVVCALLGAGAPGSSSGQSGHPGSVTFVGEVIDTYWGNPVAGAVVRLSGPDGSIVAGITGETGRFSISEVPPGPKEVSVTRIGYADLIQVLDIRDGQFVEIAVIPKPVVLEGIEVYVDRLETRLRELPFATRTFDEVSLRFAPDMNVASYLDSQPGFEFAPCFEGSSGTGLMARRRDCIRIRGATLQRPRIFVDDAPAFGGVPELASLPTTEVYRVEWIRGCAQIRIYTITYAERTASRPRPLLPIVC